MKHLLSIFTILNALLRGQCILPEFRLKKQGVNKLHNILKEDRSSAFTIDDLIAKISPSGTNITKPSQEHVSLIHEPRKAKCLSYQGKIRCQLDNYSFTINNCSQSMDSDILERFAAMVYHKSQNGDSSFEIGVNSPNKEVFSYSEINPIRSEQSIYVQCNPFFNEVDSSLEPSAETMYECKWNDMGSPRKMIVQVNGEGSVGANDLILPNENSITSKEDARYKSVPKNNLLELNFNNCISENLKPESVLFNKQKNVFSTNNQYPILDHLNSRETYAVPASIFHYRNPNSANYIPNTLNGNNIKWKFNEPNGELGNSNFRDAVEAEKLPEKRQCCPSEATTWSASPSQGQTQRPISACQCNKSSSSPSPTSSLTNKKWDVENDQLSFSYFDDPHQTQFNKFKYVILPNDLQNFELQHPVGDLKLRHERGIKKYFRKRKKPRKINSFLPKKRKK